jgi:hypothetical protein
VIAAVLALALAAAPASSPCEFVPGGTAVESAFADSWRWLALMDGAERRLELRLRPGLDGRFECRPGRVRIVLSDPRSAPIEMAVGPLRQLNFSPEQLAAFDALADAADPLAGLAQVERYARTAQWMGSGGHSNLVAWLTQRLSGELSLQRGSTAEGISELKACEKFLPSCRQRLDALTAAAPPRVSLGTWKSVGSIPFAKPALFPTQTASPLGFWSTRSRFCVVQGPTAGAPARCYRPKSDDWEEGKESATPDALDCAADGCQRVKRREDFGAGTLCPSGVKREEVVGVGYSLLILTDRGLEDCTRNPERPTAPNGTSGTTLVGNRLRCVRADPCALQCTDVFRTRPPFRVDGPTTDSCSELNLLGSPDGNWVVAAVRPKPDAGWKLFIAPVTVAP